MKKLLLTAAALSLSATAASAGLYPPPGEWLHMRFQVEGKPSCAAMVNPDDAGGHIKLFFGDGQFALQLVVPDWITQPRNGARDKFHGVTLQFTEALKFDKVTMSSAEHSVFTDEYDEELVTALGTHLSVTISLNGENPHQVSLKGAAHAIIEWGACIKKIS